MGIVSVNEKMLTRWYWQSNRRFSRQKCLIVQTHQMCLVSHKGKSHISNIQGWKYCEGVSNIYIESEDLIMKWIYGYNVYVYSKCSIYYSIPRNYQMSSKHPACLTALFYLPGSPDWVMSDFARYPAIVPMSRIPPTFFVEDSFWKSVICLLSYYSLFFFCQENTSQNYLRSERPQKGI